MHSDALLLRGGTLIDGSGAGAVAADVLIKNGRIDAIGQNLGTDAARALDCTGLIVAPGFIDSHRHIDAAALRTPGYGEVELRQGITTAIGGHCGFGLFPWHGENEAALRGFLRPVLGPLDRVPLFPCFDDYAKAVRAARPAIHLGCMMGNGALRIALNGMGQTPLSEENLRRAEALIGRSLFEGALGLTFGLMYAPECDYDQRTLTRLARAMGGRGVLSIHVRGEGRTLAVSVREAISIARSAGVSLQISHFKACGKAAWGAVWTEAKALVESAIAEGLDVQIDAYPYEAGSTSLMSLLPPSWQAGGIDALCERLNDPREIEMLQSILQNEQPDFDNLIADIGFESIVIASVANPADARYVGRDLKTAALEDRTTEAALMARLLRNSRGDVAMIDYIVSDENLRDALTLPYGFFVSDAILSGGKPHPRCCGAFPKLLRLAREGLCPMEEAVRRMTSAPAQRYGIWDRGLIKRGNTADIAVFDPETVTDHATYQDSERAATGFAYVLTGGEIAIDHDHYTGAKAGQLIRSQR